VAGRKSRREEGVEKEDPADISRILYDELPHFNDFTKYSI